MIFCVQFIIFYSKMHVHPEWTEREGSGMEQVNQKSNHFSDQLPFWFQLIFVCDCLGSTFTLNRFRVFVGTVLSNPNETMLSQYWNIFSYSCSAYDSILREHFTSSFIVLRRNIVNYGNAISCIIYKLKGMERI